MRMEFQSRGIMETGWTRRCYVEMDALHLKQKSFLFDEMI